MHCKLRCCIVKCVNKLSGLIPRRYVPSISRCRTSSPAVYCSYDALRHLVILRGPQCSGKTAISEKLTERLDEIKHKKQTYLLKLDEINTERFEYSLNQATCITTSTRKIHMIK